MIHFFLVHEILAAFFTCLECGKQALTFAFERYAEAFGPSNKQTNDEICVLFDILAVYPNAKAQKIQISLAFDRIPTDVRIVFCKQLTKMQTHIEINIILLLLD